MLQKSWAFYTVMRETARHFSRGRIFLFRPRKKKSSSKTTFPVSSSLRQMIILLNFGIAESYRVNCATPYLKIIVLHQSERYINCYCYKWKRKVSVLFRTSIKMKISERKCPRRTEKTVRDFFLASVALVGRPLT